MDDLYAAFMARTAGNERAQRELRRILNSYNEIPENHNPEQQLPPVDEFELRLEHIRWLEQIWRENFELIAKQKPNMYRPFNDLQVAAMLQMDIRVLTNFKTCGTLKDQALFLSRLQGLRCCMKMFITKVPARDEIEEWKAHSAHYPDASPASRAANPSESSGDAEELNRKQTRFDNSGKAMRSNYHLGKRTEFDRDRCIITGTSDPQICHIIPFAANSSEKNRDLWDHSMVTIATLALAGPVSIDRLRSLFASKVAESDRHWNLISLAPSLHDWWSRGYFGLKCLGTNGDLPSANDPAPMVTLRLQFHWMIWKNTREIEKKGKKPSTSLGRTLENMKAIFPEYMGGKPPGRCGDYKGADGKPLIAISRPKNGFNVENGDIFQVRTPQRHVDKMMTAFHVQWALIKLLAIAGGAEAIDDLDNEPDFTNENGELAGLEEILNFEGVNWLPDEDEQDSEQSSGESQLGEDAWN